MTTSIHRRLRSRLRVIEPTPPPLASMARLHRFAGPFFHLQGASAIVGFGRLTGVDEIRWRRPILSSSATTPRDTGHFQSVSLELDRFAGEALAEQAAAFAVSIEELATFAVLYYLADLDSGRIARRLPPRAQQTPLP